jgi:hypothetical protein
MSGDKHESEPFSNKHAAIMRIQMCLHLMKRDKTRERMNNSLVFADISFSSTVAATMLLIVLEMPNAWSLISYKHTHTHTNKHTHSYTYMKIPKHIQTHTHTHTLQYTIYLPVFCYLFIVPKMSLNFKKKLKTANTYAYYKNYKRCKSS